MKLYISTLLSIIVTLLCLARTGEASPLVVPSRQQQRKTCGNLIRGKPLLVKFCRAYLGNYRPAVLASTTTATITATSTPPPITVTVATTTSTVTSTITSTLTPTLVYPGNAPRPAETIIDRRLDRSQIPPILQPFAQVVFDACVDVLYPTPRGIGTTTVTSTTTTTLQAVTASTTITTTTTETTSTTVTADTAQTAVAPPPPQGQDATFLRIEGSTETIFEGFVNSKAKTFNFPAGPLVCDSRVGAGGSVITAIADLGLPVRVTPTYNAEGVILGRVKNDEAGQGPYEWRGVRRLIGSASYATCSAPLAPPSANTQAEDSLAFYNPNIHRGYLTATLASPGKVYVAGQGVIRVQVDYTRGDGDLETRPASLAMIGGVQALGEGDAYIPVPTVPGQYAFKATRDDMIRSNSLLVYVKAAA